MRLRTCLAVAVLSGAFANYALAQSKPFTTIERGKYLTNAGDCVACHTAEGGKPFAGGRAIETPFGTIYSPNITPDRETGIGAWSDAAFYRAMHEGIGPDGTRLYPAFPYPYYTKMSRDDVLAIRAYLNTLPPVHNRRPPAKLMWPLQYRQFLIGWNWWNFQAGEFTPDPHKSSEWNRGAYLVEGAGHCGACHTPKNIIGGDETGDKLQGGNLQNWYAPTITNDPRSGIGAWSIDDVVEYLKTGRNKHSGATGPMAEVIADSTSKLSDADLKAIATYIKDVAAQPASAPAAPDEGQMSAGKAIYADSCSGCHLDNGQGVPRMFPPLSHNANVQSQDPTSVIRIIIKGARTVPTDARPTPSSMPAYGWKLTDQQIAAVASYVRNSWGNQAASVRADQVTKLRNDLHASTH